ncbi:AAA family ATPase [Mucilaginibacter gossypii]|uniref:AAA family ATPase n=1 Tax=Mucilaginibacter gossypii TaxID=551996 RepID=UPI000DCCEB76|nr:MULTISPECIES: AAA family ATPase [Mucilaginibacter]QTE39507.1 AAA family ATPase [Mucilaginibacter gossypii]RAV56132.1 hypothetical protein DIU36_15365 [Mucilaginibacter rubeus]
MQKENLIQQARELINDYTGLKKVSKNRLASKIQVSPAVLTFIEQGNTDNLSEEMLLKVINALKPASDFTILGTSNYNSVQSICQKSQAHSLMNAVIGYTGAGKTTALYDYYRAGRNVYYVECKNSMNRRQFLHSVLLEMGINYLGSVYDMVKQIIEQLNSQTKPLVIIDEAGKVSTNVLLDLHDIRNGTMYNAGIILAGCEYFQRDMEKAVTKEKPGYPEFHSRIVNWNILNRPTKTEITAICKGNGLNDDDIISDFHRLPNYRLLYNAILNERGQL